MGRRTRRRKKEKKKKLRWFGRTQTRIWWWGPLSGTTEEEKNLRIEMSRNKKIYMVYWFTGLKYYFKLVHERRKELKLKS